MSRLGRKLVGSTVIVYDRLDVVETSSEQLWSFHWLTAAVVVDPATAAAAATVAVAAASPA